MGAGGGQPAPHQTLLATPAWGWCLLPSSPLPGPWGQQSPEPLPSAQPCLCPKALLSLASPSPLLSQECSPSTRRSNHLRRAKIELAPFQVRWHPGSVNNPPAKGVSLEERLFMSVPPDPTSTGTFRPDPFSALSAAELFQAFTDLPFPPGTLLDISHHPLLPADGKPEGKKINDLMW